MRILVVKLSSLGDLFHALPAVHNLKTGLDAEIDWLVQEEYASLVACFDDVDEVLPFYRRTFLRNFPKFVRRLRAKRYDLVVDLQGLLKSAVAARFARGAKYIGPSYRREGAGLFYSSAANNADRERHAVDQALDVIDHLGLSRVPPAFPVSFPRRELSDKRPRIAIVPRSRWQSKNWPIRRFAELARRLRKSTDLSLYLLGSAEDRPACDEIAANVDGACTNLAGEIGLVETGGVLQEMDLLVANDTGPVHMAVALGTPVLVMFGPTDPARTGPYGEGNRVLRATTNCNPCLNRKCPLSGMPCMNHITEEQAEAAAISMLGLPDHRIDTGGPES